MLIKEFFLVPQIGTGRGSGFSSDAELGGAETSRSENGVSTKINYRKVSCIINT